jgi:O-antigen/teichoic acid export membrane protein
MTIHIPAADRRARPWFGMRSLLARPRNVLTSLSNQSIVSGFSFVIGIVAARLVGIEEFGRFSLALIFVAFAQTIHNALLTAPMMTVVGRRARRSAGYHGAVLLVSIGFAVGEGTAVSLLLGSLFWYRDGVIPLSFVAAAGVSAAAQCIQFTVRRQLFSQARGGWAVAMDLVRVVTITAFLVALLVAFRLISAAEILWVLAGVSIVSTTVFGMALKVAPARLRLIRAAASIHWPIGRWLAAISFVSLAQGELVWIYIGTKLGDQAVGGLRAASYLFGGIMVLMTAMENILPLRAAQAFSSDGVMGLRAFLLRIAAPLALANGFLLLVAAVPARFWLGFLFGPDFRAYGYLVPILAITLAVSLVRDQFTQYFRAVQRTEFVFGAFSVGAVATLVPIVPLAHAYDLSGVAVAMFIGQFGSLVFIALAAIWHYRRSQMR